MIKGSAQAAVVFVFQRHKAERLQYSITHLPHRAKHLSHSMDRPSLRLKRNFDEVSLSQRLGQAQQATRNGNGLEFCFRAAAIFKPDRSQNRIA
jgi:hypothetical protein